MSTRLADRRRPLAAPSVRSASAARRGSIPLPTLIGVAGMVLLAVGVIMMFATRKPQETVGDVRAQIVSIVRAGSAERPGFGEGLLGPWRLRASSIDERAGTFTDLVIEQDDVVITAASATLVIDVEADTFAFDLEDVTYVRADAPEAGAAIGDGVFERMASHRLGPAPWGRDIVLGGPTGTGDGADRARSRDRADEPIRSRPTDGGDDGVSSLIGG